MHPHQRVTLIQAQLRVLHKLFEHANHLILSHIEDLEARGLLLKLRLYFVHACLELRLPLLLYACLYLLQPLEGLRCLSLQPRVAGLLQQLNHHGVAMPEEHLELFVEVEGALETALGKAVLNQVVLVSLGLQEHEDSVRVVSYLLVNLLEKAEVGPRLRLLIFVGLQLLAEGKGKVSSFSLEMLSWVQLFCVNDLSGKLLNLASVLLFFS